MTFFFLSFETAPLTGSGIASIGDGTPTPEGCHPVAILSNVSMPFVSLFETAPLTGSGIASSTRSSWLAHASTLAPIVRLK